MRSQITLSTLRSLYLGKRYSVAEIAQQLSCSEHKVNYWLAKYSIPKRSISEAIYQKHNPQGDPFRIQKVNSVSRIFLMGLGFGLYWGEGNRRNKNTIRLGNTDPLLIKKFVGFLERVFGVDTRRLKFSLQIFSDMNTKRVLPFWLDHLREFKISRDQFFKVTITPSHSLGTYREKSMYGVLTVYFCNIKLKKILDDILREISVRTLKYNIRISRLWHL